MKKLLFFAAINILVGQVIASDSVLSDSNSFPSVSISCALDLAGLPKAPKSFNRKSNFLSNRNFALNGVSIQQKVIVLATRAKIDERVSFPKAITGPRFRSAGNTPLVFLGSRHFCAIEAK
ncbi:MAG: hypothetical protein ACJAZS_000719 [Alteromonas naphthalenivorans]|jgi:hypothetical protein